MAPVARETGFAAQCIDAFLADDGRPHQARKRVRSTTTETGTNPTTRPIPGAMGCYRHLCYRALGVTVIVKIQ